jgi:hypothetical protein
VFFYLDAHWEGDLPRREEIEMILGRFRNFLKMIDDFRVPGDSGYGFDDYGLGKMLALRDFPFHEDRRMSVYFPTCRSEAETGTKPGCVVLVAPSLAMLISETGALQRYVCEAQVSTYPKRESRPPDTVVTRRDSVHAGLTRAHCFFLCAGAIRPVTGPTWAGMPRYLGRHRL